MLVVPLKNPDVNSMGLVLMVDDHGVIFGTLRVFMSKPSSSASNFMSSRNSSAILPWVTFQSDI